MLTQLVIWLNSLAAALARVMLAPIAWLPGWFSATLIAVGTGVLMLVAFKYTSRQSAIRRVRNQIKANMLALSLFQDSVAVSLRCQGRLLLGAVRLVALAVAPILVMLAPVTLLLGQLALWYQARPLGVGEEAVVTARVADGADGEFPEVRLRPANAATVTIGPVRVPSRRMVCWTIVAQQPGLHDLTLEVDGLSISKELAVGEGFLPTSLMRPGWNWSEALLHPREAPLPADCTLQGIEIAYPERGDSWSCGSRTWLLYWFVISLAAAFAARPLLGVEV